MDSKPRGMAAELSTSLPHDMNGLSGGRTAAAAGPHARPRGHNIRWMIIGIITVLTITNYLDRGNLSVAAPHIMHDLGISNTMMGVVLSAFVWPYALMNLPTGWAIDRFGAKVMLTMAAGLWSTVAVLTGFARAVSVFIGLRVALGVAEAPLFPAALKATDTWFPDHEKALATSIYISATQVGLAVAPPLATVLMSAFGWPAMFVIMGVMGFIAMAGWIVLYREPERHPWLHASERAYIREGQAHARAAGGPLPAVDAGVGVSVDAGVDASVDTGAGADVSAAGSVRAHTDAGADAMADAHAPVSARDWLSLFRYPTIWFMVVAGFSLQYMFWFYITWLPTYLQRAQGFTIDRAGWLAALPYIAGGVAVVLGGWISDRLILRGVDSFKARRYTMAVAALMTALTMFATAFASSPGMAVVLLTLGMFSYSLSSGNYWTIATDVVRTRRLVASVGSVQNFGGFLGGACAPVVTGLLVDRFGSFVPALILAGGLALLSALIYAVFMRKRLPV